MRFILISMLFLCGCAPFHISQKCWNSKLNGDEVIFYENNLRLIFEKKGSVEYFGYINRKWSSVYTDIDCDGYFDEWLDIKNNKNYILFGSTWCLRNKLGANIYAKIGNKLSRVIFKDHRWQIVKSE
jgi:hypothetical protein